MMGRKGNYPSDTFLPAFLSEYCTIGEKKGEQIKCTRLPGGGGEGRHP